MLESSNLLRIKLLHLCFFLWFITTYSCYFYALTEPQKQCKVTKYYKYSDKLQNKKKK